MSQLPRIYLAIDNCFASKRWTDPLDWTRVIRDLGLFYVEASADNECDPLYAGEEALTLWRERVKQATAQTGVRVANLYSGHGTYATLGLAHTEPCVRRRFIEQWLRPMLDSAGALGAGLGFFCHAFSDPVLQSPQSYAAFVDTLTNDLAELAVYAKNAGVPQISLEQMYSPHQYPYTIRHGFELMRAVYARSGAPLYLTLDVGHMYGQQRFLRPDAQALEAAIERLARGEHPYAFWVGTRQAYALLEQAASCEGAARARCIDAILQDVAANPQLFADAPSDGDPYAWLEELGCYSPIIHLQQTDNTASAHKAFTPENNARGIITAERVLEALKRSYTRTDNEEGMPPKCADIYLTLEMFSGTAQLNYDILYDLKKTVAYFRKALPVDGVILS